MACENGVILLPLMLSHPACATAFRRHSQGGNKTEKTESDVDDFSLIGARASSLTNIMCLAIYCIQLLECHSDTPVTLCHDAEWRSPLNSVAEVVAVLESNPAESTASSDGDWTT